MIGPRRTWSRVTERARTRLARALLGLVGGTAAAQGLSIALSPVLTRLYGPADFGVQAVMGSMAGVLCVVAAGQYGAALTIPEDEETALRLLCCGLACLTVTAAVVGVAVGLWTPQISAVVRSPGLVQCLWLLPMSVAAVGLFDLCAQWATRGRAYGAIARARAVQALAGSAVRLGGGLLWHGPLGLVAGDAVGQSVGITAVSRGLIGRLRSQPRIAMAREAPRAGLEFRQFPLVAVPAVLLTTSGNLLPPVLLSAFYGPVTTGHYGLAFRVVGAPMALLGAAVSSVFLGEIAHARRSGPEGVVPLFRRATARLAAVAVVVLAIGAVSPVSFAALFGRQWAPAGWYAALLSVSCALQMVVAPVFSVIVVSRAQGHQLLTGAVRALTAGAGLVVPGVLGWPPVVAIALFVCGQCVYYGVTYCVCRRLVARMDGAPAAANTGAGDDVV